MERFTSRKVAATRIWKAIQHLQPTAGARRRPVASTQAPASHKATPRARPLVRENTNTAQVIALLQQNQIAVTRRAYY